MDAAEPTYERLRDAAVAGVRWVAIARVAGESSQLIASVILARLIVPAEFGHAAIALILVPLAAILTFEGFGSALVQRKEIEHEHLETATLASIVAGLALSALTYFAAPLLAVPLFGERTSGLIQLASPMFLIAALSAVSRSVLWRELEFREVSLIETGSVALGALVAVGLALGGLEADAIVLGAMAAAVVSSALFMLIERPYLPRWHGRHLREIVGFGAPASGAGLLHVAITNVDYTILAARLGAAQVGFYWRAFQLGVVYQDKISGIMMRLAFPVYSRTKDLAQLTRLHERATRVHAATVVPLLAILIVTAPVLIPWMFGSDWQPSVLPTQILAVAGMIAAILTGFPQVLLAAGKPQALLRFNVVVLAVYAGAVFATVQRGIVAVSIAVVAVYVAQLIVVYAVLLRRVVGIPVRQMVTDLAPAAVGGLALLATCFPLAHLLRDTGTPVPLILLAVGSLGLLVHCAVLRQLFSATWQDLTALARRVLPALPQRKDPTPVAPINA
ncbi:MAG TPA: lipopolysaccharide biosynthesis protein [Solirubrobacterales bacterium]|nr:lipopolysaccharide biosynthesis protein [Solirubrobacterales bacterium]